MAVVAVVRQENLAERVALTRIGSSAKRNAFFGGVDNKELMIQREKRQTPEDRRTAKTREEREAAWSCVRNVGGRL